MIKGMLCSKGRSEGISRVGILSTHGETMEALTVLVKRSAGDKFSSIIKMKVQAALTCS